MLNQSAQGQSLCLNDSSAVSQHRVLISARGEGGADEADHSSSINRINIAHVSARGKYFNAEDNEHSREAESINLYVVQTEQQSRVTNQESLRYALQYDVGVDSQLEAQLMEQQSHVISRQQPQPRSLCDDESEFAVSSKMEREFR